MSVIPDSLARLDSKGRRTTVLERVGEKDLTEADYDRLLVENSDLVADALCQAGILDEGSKLRTIACQFAHVDVLFAECRGDELIRLVLVEDKLFRNPEQHRKVLAQLLDYAHRLQYEVDIDALIGRAAPDVATMLEENRDTLARVLRTGDFLLLVAGDRVQPRLVNFMKPLLDRRDHVMSRFEMGLVSLALYRDGEHRILVPNVVGVIERSERDLCLEVVVKSGTNTTPEQTVTLGNPTPPRESATRGPGNAWTRESLLAQTRAELGDDAAPTQKMLEGLLEFGTARPFGIRWGRGKKVATFDVTVTTPDGAFPLVSADANGWVMLHGRAIADRLGENVKRRELAALDTALAGLGRPINVEKGYPYLPSEFDSSADPRHMQALTAFLRRMADLMIAPAAQS